MTDPILPEPADDDEYDDEPWCVVYWRDEHTYMIRWRDLDRDEAYDQAEAHNPRIGRQPYGAMPQSKAEQGAL